MRWEKELKAELKDLQVYAEDRNHLDEGLYQPSLMMVVSELNSIYGWSEDEALAALKQSSFSNPLELKNNVFVWCE